MQRPDILGSIGKVTNRLRRREGSPSQVNQDERVLALQALLREYDALPTQQLTWEIPPQGNVEVQEDVAPYPWNEYLAEKIAYTTDEQELLDWEGVIAQTGLLIQDALSFHEERSEISRRLATAANDYLVDDDASVRVALRQNDHNILMPAEANAVRAAVGNIVENLLPLLAEEVPSAALSEDADLVYLLQYAKDMQRQDSSYYQSGLIEQYGERLFSILEAYQEKLHNLYEQLSEKVKPEEEIQITPMVERSLAYFAVPEPDQLTPEQQKVRENLIRGFCTFEQAFRAWDEQLEEAMAESDDSEQYEEAFQPENIETLFLEVKRLFKGAMQLSEQELRLLSSLESQLYNFEEFILTRNDIADLPEVITAIRQLRALADTCAREGVGSSVSHLEEFQQYLDQLRNLSLRTQSEEELIALYRNQAFLDTFEGRVDVLLAEGRRFEDQYAEYTLPFPGLVLDHARELARGFHQFVNSYRELKHDSVSNGRFIEALLYVLVAPDEAFEDAE